MKIKKSRGGRRNSRERRFHPITGVKPARAPFTHWKCFSCDSTCGGRDVNTRSDVRKEEEETLFITSLCHTQTAVSKCKDIPADLDEEVK